MTSTLPVVGTTGGAQAANSSIQATADAQGNINFVGPTGLQGSTITVVVTVPQAPSGAIFTGILGTPGGQGVPIVTWGGQATAGQVQLLVGQTLVVTGTGLSPGTAYTCTFATVTDTGAVQVVVPTPNSSAQLADLASAGIVGVGIINQQLSAVPSGTATDFPLIPALFQVWSYGWSILSAGVSPTKGNAVFGFPGVGACIDSLSAYEAGSNRLAGVHCSAGEIELFNEYDVTLNFYVNYSLA
jgi:hypothetical protein